MKIEHLALNVPDSAAMADWYVEHLAFRIVKAGTSAPFVRFIADTEGCMLELYSNDSAPIFNYQHVHHLSLHLAFEVDHPDVIKERLEAAGASFVEKIETADGDTLIMMKDPWNISIQLCKRAERMI
ncbi:MAG: VOC family protein [Mangrovibacterium sp.]